MMVTIPKKLLDSLEAAALKTQPHEACALLVGKKSANASQISSVYFSDNVSDQDTRRFFEIDPQLHIDVERELRNSPEEILGVWHSHPSTTAALSEQDKRSSVMKNWFWLVTGLKPELQTLAFKSSETSANTFHDVELNIAP